MTFTEKKEIFLSDSSFSKKSKQKKYPAWLDRALQGITYWVGHRQSLYRGYHLSEGALVAELCNLIYANLPKEFKLRCEVQYSDIVAPAPLPEKLRGRQFRADLAIFDRSAGRDKEPTPRFVIEVKRAAAPQQQIDDDLDCLAEFHKQFPNIRPLLVVISESRRPKQFVTQNGHSIRKRKAIGDTGYESSVILTRKAAHSYGKRDKVHYACVVDVSPNRKTRHKHQNR